MFRKISLTMAAVLLTAGALLATIFGSVRGIVHDPQHRPVAGAQVTLQANNSAFKMTGSTNAEGLFEFSASSFRPIHRGCRGQRLRPAIASDSLSLPIVLRFFTTN